MLDGAWLAELGAAFGAPLAVRSAGPLRVHHAPAVDLEAWVQRCRDGCLGWHARGATVFVGLHGDDPGHGLFALPTVDPIELMRVFAVGSHNDWLLRRTSARARTAMARIAAECPFVPYFVDGAGFKVRFPTPPTQEQARRFEASVLDFDVDALNVVQDPPDADGYLLAPVMVRHGRLELWWD